MRIFNKKLVIAALLLVISWSTQAQKGDTSIRRNTIKVDITSYWLYRDAVVFSYERVTKNKPYQSWVITAGYQLFPPIVDGIDNPDINVTQESQASGLKLGGEYRFYLLKENKYKAPRGVYLGPYVSYHNYSNGRTLEVNNNGVLENAQFKSDLNITNIGVQLGYQFVLNNRWTIDLVVVGPSVSNYRVKTSMEGNFTFDPDEITNDILEAMVERFPAFTELLDEGEFESSGSVWGYGWRYQFHLGYHFGRKKK